MTDAQVFVLLRQELARARAKHPYWPADPVHGAAVVGEEAGELLQAANQQLYEGGPYAATIREALHTATTAIRFIREQ